MDGAWDGVDRRVPRPRASASSLALKERPPLPASAILAAMSDGCLLTVDGEIVEVNDALCRLTGHRREELIGLRSRFPFWPDADRATSFELTSRVLATTQGEVDVRLVGADGSSFAAAVASHAAGDGSLLVTVIRDVSLDRAQQAELRASRALLAQAQAQALLGSWSFDVATGALTWSTQMFAMMGLRESEVAPSAADFLSRVHPDDRARYQAAYLAGIRSGDAHTIEHRIVRPDGSVRHVFGTAVVDRDPVTGRAVTVRGSAQDVTERVLRERALATSEEQFRLTMQHSPIGLALVGLDGRWLQVNEALARILGQPMEALLGSTFRTSCPPTSSARGRRWSRS